jgi:hypothetical protein
MRKFATALGLAVGLAGILWVGMATLVAAPKVCILHKPGTPAEHFILVDDDSFELQGHLQHGDEEALLSDCGPVD